jgi:glycosyltransferase involved in cell wall biosynthesis
MKVVFIYRRSSPGAFSIERVFNAIGQYMQGVEVERYYMSDRSRLLEDVRRIRALDADIYHVTGDVNYLVPLLPAGKTVLTVHDLGHYLYGLSGWKRLIYKWIWFGIPLRFASAVTCVSHSTQRDIAANFPWAREVFVVENCLTTTFHSSKREFNEKNPRILQVGTRAYKNVPRLIQALQGISCRLVLVGPIDDAIADALTESQVQFEHHVNVEDETLNELYQGCDLVSFVSTGEGFGLPILEAQASGRPLVTSSVSPLREVAGAGACLVDPLDILSIRAGIRKVIDDEQYRSRLVTEGHDNLRRFQPDVIAARYRDIYGAIRARAI